MKKIKIITMACLLTPILLLARVGVDSTGEKVLLTGVFDANENVITNVGNIYGNGAGLTNTAWDNASNAVISATNALKLTGGIMTGPVTNTAGYYGNGAGLTNMAWNNSSNAVISATN